MSLDFINAGKPYMDQKSFLEDWKALLDWRIYLVYQNHAWLGPENRLQNMMGLVVSREEFEYNLARGAQEQAFQGLSDGELRDLEAASALVENRIDCTGGALPALALAQTLGLSRFERDCVLLGFAAATDAKYEKLFSYLQDDAARKLPGMALCCQLFTKPGELIAGSMASFRAGGLFSALFEPRGWENADLELRPFVMDYLIGSAFRLAPGMTHLAACEPREPLVIRGEAAEKLGRMACGAAGILVIRGESGSGKRLICRHALAQAGKGAFFSDLRDGLEDIPGMVRYTAAAALLAGACPCFLHGEALDMPEKPLESVFEEAVGNLPERCAPVFLLTENNYRACGLSNRRVIFTYELSETTQEERAALFDAFLDGWTLGPGIDTRELSAKFRFTPMQIYNAVRQAKGTAAESARRMIGAEEIHRCCYGQAVHRLDALAAKVRPAYDWDDLILPPGQVRLLREACAHVRQSYKVYGQWGFGGRVQYGRGVSMLFAGPPGTGKTMGAQVIANQLHMELYKIQISQVVSKYIGETEKNLREVFTEARKSNSILFFDECDALFGKRASEVKDSNDRNANMETAYLLQQVEDHDGVTIMATNLLQNIDPAFMRRIGFVVHFPFPEKEMRERLYRGMLPASAPVADDVDFAFLAERFKVSGGGIKNIVLHAAFLAAEEDAPICMRHLVRSAVGELRKNEIVVVREDLREYADLAFD